MRHIVETGTDVAVVCFFDPAALPGDFNQRASKDRYKVISALADEGRICSQETGADGVYLFQTKKVG